MVYLRQIFLSVLVGIFAGVSATLFLYLLGSVTYFRQTHGSIIWFLPLAGLGIGLLYYLGKTLVKGNDLIIEQIYKPTHRTSWVMAPLILVTTLITHLFGGSAGREGTAVQMGASLADQLGYFFKISASDRKILLMSGMGAGFGAAIGAPFAGFIFGLEVVRDRSLFKSAVVSCFISSFVGHLVTKLLMAPHTEYPALLIPPLSLQLLSLVIFSGVIFGSISHAFIAVAHTLSDFFSQIKFPPLRPLAGGMILVGLYYYEGSYQYAGLGLENIQSALLTPSSFLDPVYKVFFTALTVSSGFKGGEFIPLVFIGTTLGSAIGVFFPAYFSLAAGLGFGSVFGAASKTPLACSVMVIEIFGFAIAPYILLSCFVASFVSGQRSIYKSQKI